MSLTRGEEVVVVEVGLVQGVVVVLVVLRRQDGRGHQRVPVVQQRHPGRRQGQRAGGERRGEHVPQRPGLVQQDVLDEEGRGPLRGRVWWWRRRRGRVAHTHGGGGVVVCDSSFCV